MTTNQQTPTARPTRRLVAGGVLAATAVAGIVGFTVSGSTASDGGTPSRATTSLPTAEGVAPTSPTPIAAMIIRSEIERALAELRPTTTRPLSVAPTTADRTEDEPRRAPVTPHTTARRPAYLIIQDEIDRALAERHGAAAGAGG